GCRLEYAVCFITIEIPEGISYLHGSGAPSCTNTCTIQYRRTGIEISNLIFQSSKVGKYFIREFITALPVSVTNFKFKTSVFNITRIHRTEGVTGKHWSVTGCKQVFCFFNEIICSKAEFIIQESEFYAYINLFGCFPG